MTKNTNGQAALTAVIFFLLISTAMIGGFSSMAVRESHITRINYDAKRGYFLTEAGQEDAVYRIHTGKNISSTEVITLEGESVTTTITTAGINQEVTSRGVYNRAERAVRTELSGSTPIGFVYAGQIGNGGLLMQNTSSVIGNVYSNGPITGTNSPQIDGNATSGSTIGDPPAVTGTRTENAPELSMPIPDSTLNDWQAQAEAGGTYSGSCPYQPPDGASFGPIKILCDLIVDGTKQVTITGTVWVVGDIDFKNSAVIRLSPSYGARSGIIVAHDPANTTGEGEITVQNSAQVLGSGTAGSAIILVSRNNSAEAGGNEEAIDIKNSSTAAVYYAPHGRALVQNNSSGVHLKAIAAWQLELKNKATVDYDATISSATVPSGGKSIQTWREIE